VALSKPAVACERQAGREDGVKEKDMEKGGQKEGTTNGRIKG
jgi:hypothetical protein